MPAIATRIIIENQTCHQNDFDEHIYRTESFGDKTTTKKNSYKNINKTKIKDSINHRRRQQQIQHCSFRKKKFVWTFVRPINEKKQQEHQHQQQQ